MSPDIDVYSHPDQLEEVKRQITKLQDNIAVVEGFQLARRQLSSGSTRLPSSILGNCNVLVSFVDKVQDPSNKAFCTELEQLSFNELSFVSISFSERRLERIKAIFKASETKRFMQLHAISCSERSEITTRLENVMAKKEGGRFAEIYRRVSAASSKPDGPALAGGEEPAAPPTPHHASRGDTSSSNGGGGGELQFSAVDLDLGLGLNLGMAYSGQQRTGANLSTTEISSWNGNDWLAAE